MKGKGTVAPFRVFGSPYTVLLHQHVTYLRLKQLPFKVYCTNFTTTFLYSVYYRARSCFCTVTPSGVSRLQVWQLAETAEYDEDVQAIAKSAKGEVAYIAAEIKSGGATADGRDEATGSLPARTQRMLIAKETHPSLHLASWCVVVYACWWLAKTGAMYRYIRGESLDVLEGYVRYFFLAGGIGFARSMAPRFRTHMKRIITACGASDVTAPFMDEHFTRFCTALEAHLREHPTERFLLCTPHPTLADVTLGAVFSSYFLMDDPPSSMLAEKFPCVTGYVERVTGWRGSTFVGSTDESGAPAGNGEGSSEEATEATASSSPLSSPTEAGDSQDYPDTVPESLAPCFALIAEVFPFLMSQCASFTAFMAGDGVRTLRKEPLEGGWKGCEAYLLPQLTKIKSLMIVDDDVNSVLTRAQDLEVVFLAAREVHDDALRDFGRRDEREKAAPTSTSPFTASTRDTPGAPESTQEYSSLTTTTEAAAVVGGEVAVHVAESVVPEAAAAASAAGVAKCPAWRFEQPVDLASLEAEDADFYRAFSSAGRTRLGGDATSLAGAVPTARTVPSARGASAVVVSSGGVSVMDRLAVLRSMLLKMSCPQYTLTTVFHGRRLYVAVIPEYEVAKVRKVRQETAAAAAAAVTKEHKAETAEESAG